MRRVLSPSSVPGAIPIESGGTGARAARTTPSSRPSILIVEDDPVAIETFTSALTAAGYRVRTATDAETGLAEAVATVPLAILIDLHLPVGNGLELLRLLRTTVLPSVPVALITGDYFVDDRVVEELHTLGAHLYFKPLWVDDLLRIIECLVPAR